MRKILLKRKFYFTEHALIEIDNDDLEIEDVMRAAVSGVIIEKYKNDKPYPSCLALGWIKNIPIHVVYAIEPNETIHIITAYKPSKDKWNNEFKTRKK